MTATRSPLTTERMTQKIVLLENINDREQLATEGGIQDTSVDLNTPPPAQKNDFTVELALLMIKGDFMGF